IKNLFFIPLETCLSEEGCHGVTERSAVPRTKSDCMVLIFPKAKPWFKGVRARPVGGAGAHAPETSSPRATRGFTVFLTCRSPPIRFYLILHLSLFLMLIEKK
ncbi:hypothetical protein, partial [Dialister hominis]|uniref:hypothetical protein n=1 Tax=Dialister hominis TaxID=2582419 RepID=UPI003FF0735E